MKKVLLILSVLFVNGCSGLLFFPHKELYQTPERVGLAYEDVSIKTTDGLTLNAWLIPALVKQKGVVLFLHGNAENISTHTFGALVFPLNGYVLLALDYRGFGKSDGKVSLIGSETDVDAALKYLIDRYPDQKLFVFGQSIGASIAVAAVAKSPRQDKINGLIIDSAFSKSRRIAREKIGGIWLFWPFQYPLSFLVPENNAEGFIQQIKIPKLFVTAADDTIVPPHHTKILYDKATMPKDWVTAETGGHIRALFDSSVKRAVLDFMEKN